MAKTLAKICCFGHGGTTATMMCIGIWLLVFSLQQQTAECRYLPTRSHGDDVDKLRELMLQILESSNEEQRPANEANGNPVAHRGNWLNKLGGGAAADNIDLQRKYAAHGLYDSGRFY